MREGGRIPIRGEGKTTSHQFFDGCRFPFSFSFLFSFSFPREGTSGVGFAFLFPFPFGSGSLKVVRAKETRGGEGVSC